MEIIKKNIYKIIALVLILLVGIFLVLSFKNTSTKNDLINLEGKRLLGLAIDDDNLIYFNLDNKKFVRINDGTVREFPGINFEPFEISYNYDLSQALLFGSIENPSKPFKIIDFNESKIYYLDPNISSAQFSPNGFEIAGYDFNENTGVGTLSLYDNRGIKIREIYKYQFNEGVAGFGLRWLNSNEILSLPIQQELVNVPIISTNVSSGTSIERVPSGPYLDIKPSSDGKFLAILEFKPEGSGGSDDGQFDTQSFLSLYDLDMNRKVEISELIEVEMARVIWSKNSQQLYAITNTDSRLIKIDLDGRVSFLSTYKGDDAIYQLVLSNDETYLWIVTRSGLVKLPLI